MGDPWSPVADVTGDPWSPVRSDAPVTAAGTAKAAGSGLAGSVLALSGGSLGDIRERGEGFVNQILGTLIKSGLINKGQAAAAHTAIAETYHALNPFEQGMDAASRIGALASAATGGPSTPELPVPTTQELQAATGTAYEPQNRTERFARAGGAMAINALVPGSGLARAGAVVVPALGSEGARELTEAAGGSQQDQEAAALAGAILSGAGLGVKVGRTAPVAEVREIPTGVDAASPVPAKVAEQAAAYVASRAGSPDPAMVAAAEAGKPVTTAEMLGTSGRTALGALARRSGATGDALGPALAERSAQAPERIQGDFEAATGISPEAIAGDFDAMIDARRNGPVREAYDAALAQKPTITPQLQSLLAEPEVKQALGYAERKLGAAARDEAGIPTAAALDLTKKYLGQMVRREPITGRPVTSGPEGIGNSFTLEHSRAFTEELKRAIPGYGDALSQAGDYLSLQRAYDAGGKALGPRMSAREVESYVSGLTEAEQAAYRGGVANRLFELSGNGRLNPKAFSTPAVKAKLDAALGQDAAQTFLTGVAQEKLLTDQARRMAPGINSPTAEFNAEMAAQDQPSPAAVVAKEMASDVATTTIASMGNLPLGLKVAMLRQLAKGAGILTKDITSRTLTMPEAVRDEAGRILMSEMKPDQLQSYLALAKPQQDAAIRIVLKSPGMLSKPAFVARAALGLNASAGTEQPDRKERR